MIGLFISLMIQAVVLAVQVTIIAMQLLFTGVVWLVAALSRASAGCARR